MFFVIAIPKAFGKTKKSRKEGYTAPSFRIAMWYGSAAVNCAVELYCTPLIQAVLVN